MDLVEKLQALRSTIARLLEISGAPGLSLGVLHHGSILHTEHFGRRNVNHATPPNDESIYHIASFVKLLTAGVIASLVHDGKLDWDVPIREYLPEFAVRQDLIGKEATVRDLLSNRTGLPVSHASFGHQRAEMLIPRSETIRTAASLTAVTPFREKFVYSQWNYGLLTDLVEKITGKTFGSYTRETFLDSLGMKRTHFDHHGDGDNDAVAHAVRNDFSACTILSPGATDATGLAGALGCKSSLHDLLVLYQSFLAAHAYQQKHNVDSTPNSPWKYTRKILEPHVPVGPDMQKLAYCLGIYRTALPTNLSVSSMNQQLFGAVSYPIPEFGHEHKGLEVWFHTAGMPGCHGSMFMVPSSESAVLVLANALPVVDCTDFTAQLALTVLLGEKNQEETFLEMTEMARPFQLMGYERLSAQLEKKKKTDVPPSLPLSGYEGDYQNAVGNIIYSITVEDGHLLLTVKGKNRTSFDLFPYDGDTFYWKPDREWELCEKGMWPFLAPEWHKIYFRLSEEGVVESFRWHHDPLGSPEMFRRKGGSSKYRAAREKIWSNVWSKI